MFQFKQFSIQQDCCAMKVGTDGVLLGAWTPIDHQTFSVLDIGSGTGILALMLAQRSHAEQIDAIEIDENAFEQCVENFENSPWNDRLFCFHASLDDFMEDLEDEEYDLIVSNPPFYSEDYKTENESRDLARFQEALPFEDLIEAASVLLSENGFCQSLFLLRKKPDSLLWPKNVIVPLKITRVKGTPTTEIKRSLLAFSFTEKNNFLIDELIIETARHQYTEDYIALTKDFYLKM